MKQRIFTLLMMLALVFVAGSAMAQTNKTPYIGLEYDYTLKGVTVQGSAATATITYSDASHATFPASFVVSSGTNDYTFSSTFSDGAVNGVLTVTITEGTCSNFIQLNISPKPRPALALSIAGSKVETCQNHKTGTLNDNLDAVTDGTTITNANTFDFVVTSTITNVSSGTFDFKYGITIEDLIASIPGISTVYPTEYNSGTVTHTDVTADADGTTVITDTYTITFQTVAGIADQTLDATITDASALLTITNTQGNSKDYSGTLTANTDNVIIRSMPKIGTFTIE